ncbi:hypothetical protein RIVM261_036750 [Rivularia sp. IAM M-261]|nr:hypothetical protein RIVM261_036750 [Rivularia sp. IAM M-261]
MRVLGFLAMSFGMVFALQPINTLLNLIPFFGEWIENVTVSLSFFVAFVLTTVTILVSQLLHHPFVLVAAVFITLITLSGVKKIRKSIF